MSGLGPAVWHYDDMLKHNLPTTGWSMASELRAIRLVGWRNRGIPRDGAEFRGLAAWPGRDAREIQVTRDSLTVSYDNSLPNGQFGTSIAITVGNPNLAGLSVAGSRPP